MSEQKKKKRNDKESMICLTLKYNQKKKKESEIIGISLCPPSSSDLNLLDYALWGVLENNKSYFVVYFSKLKLILFYHRVVRLFLILLPHPTHTHYIYIYRHTHTLCDSISFSIVWNYAIVFLLKSLIFSFITF